VRASVAYSMEALQAARSKLVWQRGAGTVNAVGAAVNPGDSEDEQLPDEPPSFCVPPLVDPDELAEEPDEPADEPDELEEPDELADDPDEVPPVAVLLPAPPPQACSEPPTRSEAAHSRRIPKAERSITDNRTSNSSGRGRSKPARLDRGRG
jgi:hypothetical protein